MDQANRTKVHVIALGTVVTKDGSIIHVDPNSSDPRCRNPVVTDEVKALLEERGFIRALHGVAAEIDGDDAVLGATAPEVVPQVSTATALTGAPVVGNIPVYPVGQEVVREPLKNEAGDIVQPEADADASAAEVVEDENGGAAGTGAEGDGLSATDPDLAPTPAAAVTEATPSAAGKAKKPAAKSN